MQHIPLRFRLFEDTGAFRVELSTEGAPAVTGDFEFDLRPEARVRSVIRRIEKNDCDQENLQDVGSQLWAGLLAGPVGERFRQIRDQLDGQDVLFQFRLSLPPDLQGLPWEALYDEWSAGFLASRLHYSILREPPRGIRPPKAPPPQTGRLKVLVVVPEGSGLHVEHEWQNLRDMAAKLDGIVELRHLGGRVTSDVLQEALQRDRYDVLHYIGHGEVDEGDRVRIRLNSEEDVSPERMMDAEAFAALFEDSTIRLVVLNCCQGEAPSLRRSLGGLGPYLMQAGVPAVIAMRYEIPDAVAIRFSRTLYRSLFDSQSAGRIDVAMEQARKSLFLNSRESSVRGFVTPILYLAPGCEQLFRIETVPPPPPEKKRSFQARPSLVPPELAEALQERRCVPVIGPGLLSAGAVRGASCPPEPRQLALELARESRYPRMEDFEISERAGGWIGALLLPLVCQHYVRTQVRYRLVRSIQRAYEAFEPPPALLAIAGWDVPGVLCSHFDSLFQEALEERGRAARSISALEPCETLDELIVIHLRGKCSDPQSLVLTEDEHDVLYDKLAIPPAPIVHLLHGEIGRTLLFLGVSPRDPIVRRIASPLLGPGGSPNRGTAFFACSTRDPVEEAFWSKFEHLEWIEAHLNELLEEMDALAARGGHR